MAEIPAGVVNVVTGSAGQIGSELTRNPLIRKLTFTGSTAVVSIADGPRPPSQCSPSSMNSASMRRCMAH